MPTGPYFSVFYEQALISSAFMNIKAFHSPFTEPMLIEPYFNGHEEGFASLRCTVIGNEVVEAVKRINRTNITSNVLHQEKSAERVNLSADQIQMAITATNAICADYMSVDLLVRGLKP